MIRTQVYIPDDLYEELNLLSKREGKNFSELLREGARDIIRKKMKRQKHWGRGFVGQGKTNIATQSVGDIHEYYRRGV